MVLDQMRNSMDTAVHGTSKITLVTKILPSRAFLIFCDVECMAYQLIHTFIFCR